MARKKFQLEFDGLDELMQQFKELEMDVKPIAEKALKATHEYITPTLHEKLQPSNLPAKGKYHREIDNTENQIIDEANIEWSGLVGSVDIGFSLDKSIVPIFLMKGTPTMNPVKGLNSAIYGSKTKQEIAKIQERIFLDSLEKVMNNGR